MKISDLVKVSELTLVQPDYEDAPVSAGYTSDLLSDVMANASEAGVLITIQAHKNTLAVCKLLEIHSLIICNGRETDDEFMSIAKRERVAVFVTDLNQFQASVLIGQML
ncbi:MAG: hypothetical protein PHF25_05100 [Candidatus Margulisbacteria bacterium]|nr:hypothetical protein [Candidatus Margulisiibacteriota bacterium]